MFKKYNELEQKIRKIDGAVESNNIYEVRKTYRDEWGDTHQIGISLRDALREQRFELDKLKDIVRELTDYVYREEK